MTKAFSKPQYYLWLKSILPNDSLSDHVEACIVFCEALVYSN